MLIQSNNSSCIIKVAVVIILLQVNRGNSLNTGYKKNQLMSVENVQLLKCSYLSFALNYMHLARLEIYHPDFELNRAFNQEKTKIVFHKIMSTLLDFKGIEIGSLWLINIYLVIVNYHLNQNDQKESKSIEHLNTYLKDTHDYVTETLKSEASVMKCYTKSNKFLIHQEKLKQLEYRSLNEIRSFMSRQTKIMNEFILENIELSTTHYLKFTKKNILIKDIGRNVHKIIRIMNMYNVQVNWNATDISTMQQLQENYENAHNIDWRKNKLKGCNALGKMVLNGEELYSTKEKPVHDETKLATVKCYSLGNAEMFIFHLKALFENKEFDAIKSFIDYAESNQLFLQMEKKIEYLFSLLDT
ncbi:uncharacterized protein LOC126903957 [Daktulosphaira vitifoliae]|uniref:uncharacterized protein LOC126903957 n=1 Tax=Daktulosphaira vitifoliae TaxID=58002 RepID=UPI0021AA2BC0|nr:uncharacterized protein LOC126903957 [Daktulosphaira vitifoliae]